VIYRRLFHFPSHSSRSPWAWFPGWYQRRRRWRAYRVRGWCLRAQISRRQVGSVRNCCSNRTASGCSDLRQTQHLSTSIHWSTFYVIFNTLKTFYVIISTALIFAATNNKSKYSKTFNSCDYSSTKCLSSWRKVSEG